MKRACECEGANIMARWEGIGRRPTLECVLACLRCGTGGMRQGPWQRARLRGGWRAKTATTWLDGAAALQCSGGEATARQDGRDSAVASLSGGAEAGRGSGMRQRREERRLTSGPGVLFKI
jgi:hypothetical protein